MEFIFEPIFQFLGEILLQLVVELLVQLGVRSVASTVGRPRHPALAITGYLVLGAGAGAISLWIFPTSPIADVGLRTINLFATPLVVGLILMWIGRARTRKGRVVIRLDRFSYAFIFAFSMAFVRYCWAQ